MKDKKIFYGWWIVLGSILVTCTMVPIIMSLSSKFLLQITAEMGISRSGFTFANTIVQAVGIFASPFVAKKIAGNNMRKIQSISIILFAVSYASYSIAQNVYHLYISAFFVGFFYLNSTLIPISMMITNWFVKKRGIAMSLAMAGIGLGGFIFSPIVTSLLSSYGWRITYRIMAIIVLAVALPVSLFIFKRKPSDMGLEPYGAGEENTTNKKPQKIVDSVTLSVKDSKLKPFFLILLLGILCNSIINSGALGQFPPALEEMHGATVQAAIISIYSIVGIFGKLLLGWINDRWGVVASSMFGCIAFGLSFIFMLLGDNVYMLYVMAVLFGLGNAIGTVSPPLITSAIFGSEKYAEAYGIVNSAGQVGLAVGSLLVASIFDLTKSYKIAWILLFVLTCVTLFSWVGSFLSSRRYCEKKSIK